MPTPAVPTNSYGTLPRQTANDGFGNTGPIPGFQPTQASASGPNPPQPSAAHPTILAPIIPPAVHCGTCRAIEVPQRLYRSAPLSSDPTYENGEVIVFSQSGCGVSIVDASEGRVSDLFRGDDPMFVDTTVSTFSVRIEVRAVSWSAQYTTRN